MRLLIILTTCIYIGSAIPPTNKSLCLSRNGTLQSLFEGIFYGEKILENDYSTVEYKSLNKHLLSIDLYLWYHDSKWLLSADQYGYQTDTRIYGYCAGGETDDLVPQCTGCWVFYWQLNKAYIIEECSFMITTDLEYCPSDHLYNGNMQFLDSLCVNDIDSSDTDTYGIQFGEYILTDKELGIYHRIPDENMMIWHNKLSNHWFVGADEEHPLLLCHNHHENNDVDSIGYQYGLPEDCHIWDEDAQISKDIESISITAQCEGITNKSKSKKGSAGIVVLVVILCLLFIGGAFAFWWFKIRNADPSKKRVKGVQFSDEDDDKQTTDAEMIQESELVATGKQEMISVTEEEDAKEEEDEDEDNMELEMDDNNDEEDTEAEDPLAS